MFDQSVIVYGLAVLLVGIFSQYVLIQFFRKSNIFQNIYQLSPESHQKKAKTPTLGGIGIMLVVLITGIPLGMNSPYVAWMLVTVLSMACLGFWDDFRSIVSKKNQGLRAKEKFFLQVLIAGSAIIYFHFFLRSLNVVEIALCIFLIVGTSNACNLTDGLDGLLAGNAMISLAGFFYLSAMVIGSFQNTISEFIVYSMIAILSFWLFNRHPAKIFMGDTGSLAIGTLLACLAIVLGEYFALIPFGAVYILETLSVIVQVAVYKRRQKRVFLMAPLHHHFEMMGMKERHVVYLFYTLSMVFLLVYFV